VLASGHAVAGADLIFYDLFLSDSGARVVVRCLCQVFARCGGKGMRALHLLGVTGVRVALLAAGFYVAQGLPTDR